MRTSGRRSRKPSGKSRGVQLTAGDMLALRQLEARSANIRDLTGLEHAHNLTTLILGGTYVSGKGNLNSNSISDFSPLFGLAQLTTLGLSSVPSLTYPSCRIWAHLKSLDLGTSNLSDVSPCPD